MGNLLNCMRRNQTNQPKGDPKVKGKKGKKTKIDDQLLEQQAIAMLLYQQQMRFERSTSVRGHGASSKQGLPRSASARPRDVNDPILQPHQLLKKQEVKLAGNVETKHFVLVHGGGLGAWCWYKSIALLEEADCVATAIDLTGSGIDSTDPNSITSLAHYVRPLIEFFQNLSENEKVILVGHNFGGACISYVMEQFPQKIAKAIFVTAAMVASGQRAFDVFAPEVMNSDDLLPKAQSFVYANPDTHSPTSIEFDRKMLKDMFFNQSPAKDVALASVSMRPMPFAPVLEKLSLTDENYGRVPRYFIETTEDQALTPSIQGNLVSLNPPKRVFKLKGSDHCPFFSKPQALHKMFLEIAQIEPNH